MRRETTDDRWALAAWAGVAAAMAWPLTAGPNASATALAFGALLAARGHGVRAGGLAGLAFLFRPEIGVAAALGSWVLGGRRTWTPLLTAAAVAFVGLLPFLVVSPGDLLSQTFGFAGRQHLQWLPFPLAPHTTDPNKMLERLFPAILVAGTVLWAAAVLPRRRGGALVPLVLAGLAYLLARTDEFHLVPLAAVLAVARRGRGRTREPAGAADRAGRRPGAHRACTGSTASSASCATRRTWSRSTCPRAARSARCPTTRAALAELATAVDKRSRRGDPIVSAPPRYDRVRFGDTLLYRLLDRSNPTRYDVMQPGVVTTASVQREMRRDIAAAGTRLVVRWESPAARAPEPNGSGRSSGVTLLDDWIRSSYRRIARYGDYVLLERR